VGFDLDSADFSGGPVVEAAPGPIFGPLDEAALDGIAVDVLELLDELGMGEDVEVVVTGLPELEASPFEEFGGLSLQDTECVVEPLELGFAEKQVDVLGHEYVPEDEELVTLAEGFECVQEDRSGVVVVEVGESVVTTEGEEMEMAFGLVALKTAGHGTSLWSRIRSGM
jgi:hypothetical protein